MGTVALCLIAKHEEKDQVQKLASKMEKFVDAIYITLNGKEESIELPPDSGNIRYSYFRWIDDFSAARNFNFLKAKEDWIFWCDSDDIVQKPENIRKLITKSGTAGGYFIKYLYDKDDNGRVTTWHWKCRLLKNNGQAKWEGRVHEDLIQQRQTEWYRSDDVVVDHQTNGERRQNSTIRNIKILLDIAKSQEDNPDPRTLFYLGTAYMQLDEPGKALNIFWKYLELSGWDEERYEVRLRMADIYISQKSLDKAKAILYEAMSERPDYPDAYFSLAKIYQLEEDWGKSAEWSLVGFTKKAPDSNVIVFPQKRTWIPASVYAYSLMNLGKLDEAMAAVDGAVALAPEEEYLIQMKELITHLLNNKTMLIWFGKIAGHLKSHHQGHKIPALLQSVPTEIQNNVIITKIASDFLPPRKWPRGSIVFVCGLTAEPWSPKSLDGGGIGGSETAVIHLAKFLAAKGRPVTVFNWCDNEEGVYDGVEYKNYWTMRTNDKYDTLVIWRSPVYVDYNLDARKIFIDMHDVPNISDFTLDRLQKINKIMVKSEYHRSLFVGVPDDKFLIISNGIDTSRYEQFEEKISHSAIYSSAPNRGLDILLQLWPKIKEKVPGATLRIFYGWKTFYELQKNNPHSIKWMKKIQGQMESLKDQGVIDMGRVGQKELAQWQKRSWAWLYPTYFPEISCITAMEVQAAGCIPVCTDYAALDETVQFGDKISGDIYQPEVKEKFLETAIKRLSDGVPSEVAMTKWAKETYGWDSVSQKWYNALCE